MYPLWELDAPAPPARLPPYITSGIGLLYIVLWVWYIYAFNYTSSASSFLSDSTVLILKILETSVLMGMSCALLYAGYWLASGQYSRRQQVWGAVWTVIGSMGIIAVVLVVNAHQMTEGLVISPQLLAEEILLGGAGGGFAGLLIGLGTMESMKKSDEIRRQRDALEFLNKLLRHNLLNGINIIHGTVNQLEASASAEFHDQLSRIKDRSRSIAELTRNVKHMAGALSGEPHLERIDLSSVLQSEIDTARKSFPEAEFETTIPQQVTVLANPAIHGVFDNLLTNAVEHNDSEVPHIEIHVEECGSNVRVHIADNGPGIGEGQMDSIFEPNGHGEHGVGLYLVQTIINEFDGEVTVEANEPRGTVFSILLPLPD